MLSHTIRHFSLKRACQLGQQGAWALVSPRMSAQMFYLDFYIYPALVLVCLAMAYTHTNILAIVEMFVVGLATWTLAEYVLHRFILHKIPYFVDIHHAHHHDTLAMIGTPTVFSLLLFYLCVYLPIWLIFGTATALPWFSGFVTGYVAFAAAHYAIHHINRPNKLLRRMKKLHAIHHHGDANHNFGVLTDFWDHVFGTFASKIERQPKSQCQFLKARRPGSV